jgi:hypothetical protein
LLSVHMCSDSLSLPSSIFALSISTFFHTHILNSVTTSTSSQLA